MCLGLLLYLIPLIQANPYGSNFELVDRDGWGARPPKSIQDMSNPVPYVIIHHTYLPPACNTSEECVKAMQWMQNLHQVTNGWVDIGYSFCIGGDFKVYQGRGWTRVGAHAPTYNDKSIGICLIGDWRYEIPPQPQLDAAHNFIEFGVSNGHIKADYTLFGHRQVRAGTECPGDALFDEIQKWPHFSPDPPSVWTPNNTESNIVEVHK